MELELLIAAPELRGDFVGGAQRVPQRLELLGARDRLAVDGEQDVARGEIEIAERAGAIEELDELVDFIEEAMRFRFFENEVWSHIKGKIGAASDLLVRHGRVIRDGSGYRWKTKGDSK